MKQDDEHDHGKSFYIESAKSCVERFVTDHGINAESYDSRLYIWLLQKVCICAAEYAHKNNLDQWEFSSLLDKICELSMNIMTATTETSKWHGKGEWGLWQHHRDALNDIRSKNIPYIEREAVENSIQQYLDLPFRSNDLDRLLVDLLIAMEVYAFGNEMLNEVKFPGISAKSLLRRGHPLWRFLAHHFINFLIVMGIIYLFTYMGRVNWIDADRAWEASVAITLIFFVRLAIGLIRLPLFWKNEMDSKKKAADLLEAMLSTYSALTSSGPISIIYIQEKVKAASEKGVVWPAPLFALLDDIVQRTRRL